MADHMIYIRLKTSDTWHWQPSCSNRPGNDAPVTEGDVVTYRGRFPKPSYGELCNECGGKERLAATSL